MTLIEKTFASEGTTRNLGHGRKVGAEDAHRHRLGRHEDRSVALSPAGREIARLRVTTPA